MHSKTEIRALAKSRRRQMTAAERDERSRRIFERIRESGSYRSCAVVCAYASLPDEVQTEAFLRQALSDGKRVALPRTDRKNRRIRFFYIERLSQLRPGVMGIPEPEEGCERAELEDVWCQRHVSSGNFRADEEHGIPDKERRRAEQCQGILLILPGVAFDKERNRLGYGGGFYDRCLMEHPVHPAVAVAYDCQIFENVPAGPLDIRPDRIFTETRVIL